MILNDWLMAYWLFIFAVLEIRPHTVDKCYVIELLSSASKNLKHSAMKK